IFRWLGAKFVRDESQTRSEGQGGEGGLDASGDLNRVSQVVAAGAVTPISTSALPKVEVIDATGGGHVNGNGNFSFIARTDAPTCPECGSIMIPNGSCHKCVNCGTTSGCS
ncbi:MAG: hypothetical protein ABJA82_16370, partial [Myxococcales bacterium]